MSLLYLTANAVAAQKPTRRYLNSVRELAIQLQKNAPEYSGICLPAFFDDDVTEALLEQNGWKEDELNIGTFASSLAELAEWKAKEQEEVTKQVTNERDQATDKLDEQTRVIIESAVEANKNRLGVLRFFIIAILHWPVIAAIILTIISTIISILSTNWNVLWVILVAAIIAVAQEVAGSDVVVKKLLERIFPGIDSKYNQKISKNLRKSEEPYSEEIIRLTKSETKLFTECQKILGKL